MKNRNRHFWIIALVAIMTFAFVGCGGDETTETFTVTFNANGGTPAPQAKTVEKGGKVTEPQGVTKANSTLDGWYKETAFSSKWNFATDTVTADITLHAKWVLDPAETTKPLSFGTDCKVTIKSAEKFTQVEWDTLCDNVVATIMRGYNKNIDGGFQDIVNKYYFEGVFAGNVSVVLSSSAIHNCEVKSGDYTTLYFKTSALDTIDVQPAIWVLAPMIIVKGKITFFPLTAPAPFTHCF
jgi:uncharacterized repeat protein (TIGR02543 family)